MFNLFISEYRRKKKFGIKGDPEDLINLGAVEPNQDHILEVKQVANALELLPRDQKEALILVCVHDFKYQDAANHLSIPIGTVRSRLARARSKLRHVLDDSAAPCY